MSDTAGRHIAAARVCRNHPQVVAMVASGALHASALSLLSKQLTPDNAGELFERCTKQSARKVEELLATRFLLPSGACAGGVFLRDGIQLSYVSAGGRRSNARRALGCRRRGHG